MGRILQSLIFLVSVASTLQKEVMEPELPLCPTSMNFFPQELPMHCRLARSPKDFPEMPPMPPGGPPMPPMFPPSPPGNDKPPQFPPIPPGYNFPGAVYPGPPPGALPMPMPVPMPMPLGMPPPPSAKLPVIVMPFYSPDPKYKKNKEKEKNNEKDTDSDIEDCSDGTDSDSDRKDYWLPPLPPKKIIKHRHDHRHHRRRSGRRSGRSGRKSYMDGGEDREGREGREILTPVIQYVTRDGYVIYEKEISKGEAKDWLSIQNKEETDKKLADVEDMANQEMEQEVEDNMLKDKGLMERNPEIMLSQKPAPPVRSRRKKKMETPQQKTTER